MKNYFIIIFLAFTLIIASSLTCFSQTNWNFNCNLSAQCVQKTGYIDKTRDTDDTISQFENFIILSPELSFAEKDNLFSYLSADLYRLDYKDENNKFSADLTNCFISFNNEKLNSKIGLMPLEIGDGFLLNSRLVSLSFDIKNKDDKFINFSISKLYDKSPLFYCGYKINFNPFEKINFFSSIAIDKDNFLADTFNPFIQNYNSDIYISKSEGYFFWMGVSCNFFLYDNYIKFVLIGQQSSNELSFSNTSKDTTFSLPAFLTDFDFMRNVSDNHSIGFFLHIENGSDDLSGNTKHLFLTLDSSLRRSSIFFSDGLDFSKLDSNEFSASIIPRGVISPGLQWQFSYDNFLLTELTAACLIPYRNNFNYGSKYGWETDFNVNISLTEKDSISIENGLFIYGDKFDTEESHAFRFSINYIKFF